MRDLGVTFHKLGSWASGTGMVLGIAKIAAVAKQCCCIRFKCVPDGENRCGDPKQTCVADPEGEYASPFCNGMCPDPPPKCCDPPCDESNCEICEPNCEECPENPLGCCNPTCVSQCSDCEVCVDGGCQPKCPPETCLTCVEGECASTCGPCEFCSDGVCVPCPDGTVCVDGVCVPPPPAQWFCCLDEVEEPPPPSEGEPPPPSRPPTASCHYGPCGKIVDGYFVPKPEWKIGGPYIKPEDCSKACRPHDCVPDNCGNEQCLPTNGGQYLSREVCQQSGECNDVPENGCSAMSPASPFCVSGGGTGDLPDGGDRYFFTVGVGENLPICVAYQTNCLYPIRVQIWSPELGADGCTVIADRVKRCDSDWRCFDVCDCNLNINCKGPPNGFCKWRTKQKFVTTFEVVVFAPCNQGTYDICVTCGSEPECWPLPPITVETCCCECGTMTQGSGMCCQYPFGISGGDGKTQEEALVEALLTIKWCDMTHHPFGVETEEDPPQEEFTPGRVKGIYPVRVWTAGRDLPLIYCHTIVNPDGGDEYELRGYFYVEQQGYWPPGGPAYTFCRYWAIYQWKIGIGAATGSGNATVTLIEEIEPFMSGADCAPCRGQVPEVLFSGPCGQ